MAKFNFHIIQKIIQYGLKFKFILILSILMSFVLGFASSLRPYLVKIAVDDYIIPKDIAGLNRIILAIGGLLMVEVLLQLGFLYYINLLGQLVIKNIRTDLFKRLLSFKLSYFDKTPIGTIVSRSISDIETIATVFNNGILVVFGDSLKLLYVIVLMFLLNYQLALIIICIIPIIFFVTRLFQKAIKKGFQEERQQVSVQNSFVQEHLSGMNIIQAFSREETEFKEFKAINIQLLKAHLKNVFYFSLFFPVIDLISAISIGVLIWYGGWINLEHQSVKPGEIIAFFFYIQMMFRPMRQIADRFNQMLRGLVGAERVFSIIDQQEMVLENGDLDLKVQGKIEFKKVNFSYLENERILKDLSFTISAGENIAIIGETGAGKSTIINLLSKLYPIDSGSIEIDGINIDRLNSQTLRPQIAVVLQDVFLFSGTLRDNITLYQPIKEEELIFAAKEIGLYDFIQKLKGGFDFEVKERGSSLSLGQRQLIAFLRAYISKAQVLILDEATASIDTETEILIQNATEKITKNRTSIVIAHRLQTIKNSHKIMVLDKGELIEFGSHDELIIKKDGKYQQLYNLQFKS